MCRRVQSSHRWYQVQVVRSTQLIKTLTICHTTFGYVFEIACLLAISEACQNVVCQKVSMLGILESWKLIKKKYLEIITTSVCSASIRNLV